LDTIKSYRDLCEEIKIWEERLKAYEVQKEAIRKLAKLDGPQEITGIDYSQPNVQNTSQIDFFTAIEMINKIDNHIYIHQNTIERLTKIKEQIKQNIENMDGLDKKVAYMRDVEGKKLIEIADELGYSEIYIKKISARNPSTINE
jgi:DNA-directed RNA polymerase specialized sigma subunit